MHIYKDYTPKVLEQLAKYHDAMSTLYYLRPRLSLLFSARLQITLANGAKKRLERPNMNRDSTLKLTNKLQPDQQQAELTALSSLFHGWTNFTLPGITDPGPADN